MPNPSRWAVDRLWHRVDKTDTCWLWLGRRDRMGYGKTTFGRLVHRRFYTALRGPIPAGLALDHLCQTKLCVNPDHLEPVTGAENTRRARALQTHCLRGHPFDEANTRLTPTRSGGFARQCRACARLRYRTHATTPVSDATEGAG